MGRIHEYYFYRYDTDILVWWGEFMNIYVGMKRNNIIYLTIVRYNEADIIPCSSEEPKEEREREALRGAVLG